MTKEHNHRSIGTKAEDVAAAYLTAHGMKILHRNFRSRKGEIDLIGLHNGYLVFLEVKYRATWKMGAPQEAVGMAKQRVICKVADYYRCVYRIPLSAPVRYDVVCVTGEEIEWCQNAFPHRYS